MRRLILTLGACSGAGFAYCNYFYHKRDMKLGVASVGDNYYSGVSGDAATCDKEYWHKAD